MFGIVPNKHNTETVKQLPLDKLLLETDAPYFVPHELKKLTQIGVPPFAYFSASQIAQLKGVSLDTILKANLQNAQKLFGIKLCDRKPEYQSKPRGYF